MEDKLQPCLDVHRELRRLPEGEGPYPGVLVTDGETVAVAVDPGHPAVNRSWFLAGAEHIAAPRDVALAEEGESVLMPWCGEEALTLLARRAAAAEPLGPGEITTLVISLLRGLAELGAAEADTPARWWLSYEIRPLLVLGEGGSALAETRDVLERLREESSDRAIGRLLGELVTALERPRRVLEDTERWEEGFFQLAASRPLRVEVYAPTAARQLALPRAEERAQDAASRPWQETLRALTEDARGRLRALGDRMPGVRRGRVLRPRPALAAALIGAGVLLAGVLWPAGGDEQTALAQEIVAPRQEAEANEDAPAESDSDSDALVDPAGALGRMLELLADCAETGECPEIMESAAEVPDALLERAAAEREVALLDDYGDIAVLRLSAGEQPELIVVLSRRDELWLVRDIYDAVNQPE